MYGKAERVTGEALGDRRGESIIATKVWTPSDDEAEAQLDASASFYGGHVELMQIHNMVAWRTRLDQIEARRDAGEIGYVGATHWQVSGYDDLEAAMRTGRLDAIQIPYNPIQREVEERILPLAADLGLGVLIMRPFARADLLRTPPPDAELASLSPFGVTTWGQALLKWCLGHPATTVAIPATTKPASRRRERRRGHRNPLRRRHPRPHHHPLRRITTISHSGRKATRTRSSPCCQTVPTSVRPTSRSTATWASNPGLLLVSG